MKIGTHEAVWMQRSNRIDYSKTGVSTSFTLWFIMTVLLLYLIYEEISRVRDPPIIIFYYKEDIVLIRGVIS